MSPIEQCILPDFNSRLAVAESTLKRHDDDNKQIWKVITDLQICVVCLPGISTDLHDIKNKVTLLDTYRTTSETVTKTQNSVFDTPWGKIILSAINYGVVMLIAFILAVSQHVTVVSK